MAAAARTRRAHRWVKDACVRCGLHRRETWLLDRHGRAVMALVWSNGDGDLRVQPFPPMKGIWPPDPVTHTREEAFGLLPVGPEPACEPTED